MSEYLATIRWERGEQIFSDNKYSRGHHWEFDGGLSVPASSSPDIVPLPYSVKENVDPEEAFVASLSSCHMLFFLSLAQNKGLVVDSYSDNASGLMEKDKDGKTSITRVTLRPNVKFSEQNVPASQLEAMHHQAHDLCFIANSVKTDVVIEIVS